MLRPTHIINIVVLFLMPVAVFAHPGHADGSPVLHEMSHALHYIVALVAIGIWSAPGVTRLVKTRIDRKRAKR